MSKNKNGIPFFEKPKKKVKYIELWKQRGLKKIITPYDETYIKELKSNGFYIKNNFYV